MKNDRLKEEMAQYKQNIAKHIKNPANCAKLEEELSMCKKEPTIC